MHELDRDECLALLATTDLGRLAVNAPGWPPVIRPVNFVYDDRSRSIVFRSARGAKLTALLLTQQAAFEVDGRSEAGGWSVIVQGRVEEVSNAAELTRLQRLPLRPALSGDLPHWMRLGTTVVSGRRLDLEPYVAAGEQRLPIKARSVS